MRGPPHPSSPDCLLSGFISQRIPFTAGRLAGTRGAAPPRARSAFGAPGSASPLVRDAGLSPDRVCGSRGHQGPGRSVSRARLSGGAVGVAGVSGAQGRPLVAPLSPGSFRFRRLLPPRGLCGRKGANPGRTRALRDPVRHRQPRGRRTLPVAERVLPLLGAPGTSALSTQGRSRLNRQRRPRLW